MKVGRHYFEQAARFVLKNVKGSTSRQLLGTAADAVVIGGGDSSTLVFYFDKNVDYFHYSYYLSEFSKDFYSSKTGTFCSKPLLLPQPTSPQDHHRQK